MSYTEMIILFIYAIIAYIILAIFYKVTSKKRNSIQKILRGLVFIVAPISMPIYIFYLIKNN